MASAATSPRSWAPAGSVTDLDIGVDVTDRLNLSGQINTLFSAKPGKLPVPLLQAWQSCSRVNNGPISAAGGF